MMQRETCSYWLKGRSSRSAWTSASTVTVRIPATQGICPNFLKGTCRFGDLCRMSHRLATDSETQTPPSPPFAAPRPCKFFPKGRCNRGEDCPFGHTVSNSVVFNPVNPFHGRRRIEQSLANKYPWATTGTTRGGPSVPPFERDDDLAYAMRLQNEFDDEDRALSAERIKLSQTAQQVFECGICMEEMPEDSVARLDPCEHCLLSGEHRFPILCPTCAAGKGKGRDVAGEVSQTLAQDLGLTDEQFDIWIELEMTSFSVLLHCRK
ncbi:hypothetical protein H4582DRAFT_1959355 [Lactarius indigo]|nr:hypothetical protein H4582DRAFT_1959355 [Lactarius indigo]